MNMYRNIIIALSIAMVSCCARNEVDAPDSFPEDGIPMEVIPSVEAAKTALTPVGDMYQPRWTEGDALAMAYTASGKTAPVAQMMEFTSTISDEGRNAVFSGTVTAPESSGDYDFYAVFPFSSVGRAESCDAIPVDIPQTQVFPAGNIDPAADVLVGRKTTLTITPSVESLQDVKIQFCRPVSIIHFKTSTVKDEAYSAQTVQSVTISGDAAAMSGRLLVNAGDPGASAAAAGNTADKVIGVPAAPVQLKDLDGMLVVMPGKFAAGSRLKISVRLPECTLCKEVTLTSDIEFSANGVQEAGIDFDESWTQSVTTFTDGDGSSQNPYQIATAADLVQLSQLSNGSSASQYTDKHYIQTADINLQGIQWTPICSTGAFSGSYDGQGHCIGGLVLNAEAAGNPSFVANCEGAAFKDMVFGSLDSETYDGTSAIRLGKLDSTDWTFIGLFGNVANTTMQNITNFVPFEVLSTANAKVSIGAFAGGFTGASLAENCVNRAALTDNNGDTAYRQNILGGCFGSVYSSGSASAEIKDCLNFGTIKAGTGSCQYLGGILGKVEESAATQGRLKISGCGNYGNVLNVSSNNYSKKYVHIGGIIGASLNTTMTGCFNNADLSGTTAVWHQTYGGIIGYPQSTKMDSCVNNGKMSTSMSTTAVTISLGGIVGWTQNTNTIEKCVNNGDLYARRNQVVRCGGIAGTISNTVVRECENTAKITVDQSNTATGYWVTVAGIVGFVDTKASVNTVNGNLNRGDVDVKASITSSTATVLAGVGGIIGVILPTGTYNDNINADATISASNTGTSPCYVGGVFGHDYTVAVTEMTGNACKNSTVIASGPAAAAGGFIGASVISTVIRGNKSIGTTVSCSTGYGNGAVVGYNTATIDGTTVSGTVGGTVLTADNYLDYAFGTNSGTVSNTRFSSAEEYDFSGGNGTASNPYVIATAADLCKLAELSNGASEENFNSQHYIQKADIDLDGCTWTPIGAATSFKGCYDGDGHCISNMVYNATSGLPSFIANANGAEVRDIVFGSRDGKTYDGRSAITFSGTETSAWTFMGLIANATDTRVEGIVNFIPFTVLSGANAKVALAAIVAGVVGKTSVTGCTNNAAVTDLNGDSTYIQNLVGGICGSVYSSGSNAATISGCTNNGEVSASTASCQNLGGILGKVETSSGTAGKLVMDRCVNNANVKNVSAASYDKKYIHIGGICGSSINSEFVSCTNRADISGSTAPQHQTLGGIIGYPQSTTLTSCTNSGDITTSTDSNVLTVSVGGIAGWTQNTNTIQKCINEGAVSARRNQVVRCGGIAGTISNTDVISCTNSGTVTLDQSNTATGSWQAAGGIVGFVDTKASVNNVLENVNKGAVDLKASVTSSSASVLVASGGIAGIILPTGKYSGNVNYGAAISAENSGTSACYAGGVFGLDYTVAVTEMKDNINDSGSVRASGSTSAAGGFIGASVISSAISGNKSIKADVTCSQGYGAGAVVGWNTATIDGTSVSGSVNGTVLNATNYLQYASGTNTGTVSNTVFAEASNYSFSGGDGTAAAPFIIGNADDLVMLGTLSNNENASTFNTLHYVLGADIDMAGKSFSTIANSSLNSFRGSFSGNGHKISNLNCGGLFGTIDGAVIDGIILHDATVSGTSSTGAICNTVLSGTIRGCRTDGSTAVTSTGGNAGGIAGAVDATGNVLIDACSALATVKGQYNVGGIAGSSVSGTFPVVFTNCVFAGNSLTATGAISGSSNVGGIAGLLRNADSEGSQEILNCASILPRLEYPDGVGDPCAGGIIGRQEGYALSSSVQGCWSTFQLCYLWKGSYNMTKAIDNNSDEQLTYGGIVGSCSNDLKFKSCYWFDSTKMGPSSMLGGASGCSYAGRTATLLSSLNNFSDSYTGSHKLSRWETDTRDYPVPAGQTTDNPGHNQTRVSIIGASVSTFRSWITIGNAVYFYDGRDGFDVSWNDTYWNRLINNKLPNARFEKNIAWSGSCMASCDSQVTKPGFVTRYEKYGISSPDIIILAGPANEANRNNNGTKVDATAGYAFNVEVPDAALEKLYNTPLDQLDTKYFLDATVKMVQMLHSAHPKAILVLEIYDYYLNAQMEHGIAKIANHYDYVTLVDFYADGYNNIPKYSGHPLAAGHEKMATKIYEAIKNQL